MEQHLGGGHVGGHVARLVFGAIKDVANLRHCAADALHEQGKKREDIIEEVLSLVGRIAR